MSLDTNTRQEKDLLGMANVPANALYGIQTHRAIENFTLSGVPINHFPEMIKALAMVKQACAIANNQLGLLPTEKFNAIVVACEDLKQGKNHDSFLVDMIQGGAGTSTNMNANEVIANLALKNLGHSLADYKYLHPNDDVNLSQSTNDVYPTAVRLSILMSHGALVESLKSLRNAMTVKANEFTHVIKMGRTQLQDAVPMSLGQEFQSFASTLTEDVDRIAHLSELLTEINLGGTAIGTGINAHHEFGEISVKALRELSGFPMVLASDLIEASSDMGAFVLFSSMLKRLSIKLSKIANDLRLLSMGPRAGLGEINLPAQQPGSSIMPGKINPVIPEAVSQVAYKIIGHDLSVTMAAEAGQLQLNAMEPLIAYSVLDSIALLTRAMHMFEHKCISGITANEEHCRAQVNNSIGIITAVSPYIGYENASRIAKLALNSGKAVLDIVREEALLSEDRLLEITDIKNLINPVVK
ncbi:aspartate ammonia-lyase [Colwellia sp. RE-S-Sl-9]